MYILSYAQLYSKAEQRSMIVDYMVITRYDRGIIDVHAYQEEIRENES
jgi:hypothetical protein